MIKNNVNYILIIEKNFELLGKITFLNYKSNNLIKNR